MKLAVLFSGGKDSTYAAYLASKAHKLAVLVTLRSKNPESYMFHYPSIDVVKLQAEAMGLPLILRDTEGIKEEELDDLKAALKDAKDNYNIEGVVSGALYSNYQKERVDKICKELRLESIAPLWHKKPRDQWPEMFDAGFRAIMVGIAADKLTKDWLGIEITPKVYQKLCKLHDACYVCPGGEGGEFESLVIDCPLFNKQIKVEKAEKVMTGEFSGYYDIEKAKLILKR